MKKIKAVMVGQPNVGKSSIINAISNARLHVGNFAGVTVEKKEVEITKNEYELDIVDLPGIYSLHAYTPEEHVTKKYLLQEEYDVIINVVDANVLQRNLIFTLQLLDMQKKMILVVNMIDEVEEKGGSIDAQKLSELLGIPVILTSAKQKRGVEEIPDKLIEIYESTRCDCKIYYNEKIEEEIEKLSTILLKSPHIQDSKIARFYTIRLLEKDEDVYKIIHDLPIFLELHEALGESMKRLELEFDIDDVRDLFAQERNALAKSIVMQVMQLPRKESLTDKIDKILIHPIFGLPIFLFFMWALFQLTFEIGSIPMDYIDQTVSNFADWLKGILPPGDLNSVITDGVIPAVGAIIMFLPNILILFLGINLLEQTGYMSRAAFLLDGFLKKFGLQGKAFIPLVSGFGCTVPAYMAARTLKNPKDRLITMLILGFMNCSARLPVYVLFIAAFFPTHSAGNVLFAIYILGAILGLIVAKILRIVLFKGEPEPFVMEMPPYRFPSLKALAMELWIKTKLFIKKAGTFIAGTAMIIWFLSSYPVDQKLIHIYEQKIEFAKSEQEKTKLQNELAAKSLENSYLGQFGKAIEPIFAPLGFDWRMSVATISGLAAKEVVVSTLATLYAVGEADENNSTFIQKLRENIDFKAAIALIIIIMIYSPCVAAMSTFYAEVPQWAWRTFYTIYPNVLAWIMAFLAYNILSVAGF
ncbi:MULTISPECIES: ferrous iron transport protein B [unclassified Nitratiruptor]|uniref:ferrous iron transport protein B n=1 Tax=unclassified Nitratiruptor TaxID=2624044 RepID=UPI0019158C74|nr:MULTISPECIES: ferrous iron transport protein B [unclassified Nitratiruptor]BCD60474.1 ferrous iron transport protein B [Nitratiruptor sp. YY08-10]BCD64037.1 ferrous iron transport protein B [Nitratiruptor sp. YY08-14]